MIYTQQGAFSNEKNHDGQPDLLRHTGFLRVDCVERNEARVEVNQAARHVHARDGGHVERTVVTAKIAAKKKLLNHITTANEIISTFVKGAAGPPAARECVALHEAVGVEGQQLHALRQDQLASAAGARTVFPDFFL